MNTDEYFAEKIILFFRGRKGFRQWWDYLEDDVQEEIKEELQDLLTGSGSRTFNNI